MCQQQQAQYKVMMMIAVNERLVTFCVVEIFSIAIDLFCKLRLIESLLDTFRQHIADSICWEWHSVVSSCVLCVIRFELGVVKRSRDEYLSLSWDTLWQMMLHTVIHTVCGMINPIWNFPFTQIPPLKYNIQYSFHHVWVYCNMN